MKDTTRTATDTRYLVVTREESLNCAGLTLDIAENHKMITEHCPAKHTQDCVSDAWHLGMIEYTADETYIAVHVWIDTAGRGNIRVWPRPNTLPADHYVLDDGACNLREVAYKANLILSKHGVELLHASKMHTTDLVSY